MENKFTHKKAFGQNFLTDKNLLSAIVRDAKVTKSDTVIEVGAGLGALTEGLAQNAGKVISFEIDPRLKEPLNERFLGVDNLSFVFEDVLNFDTDTLVKELGQYKLVANLPYYITTPVLFKFVEGAIAPNLIAVMVQSEVADRLVALPSSKEYGALSVCVQWLYQVEIARQVGRKMFVPVPDVDSAVVVLTRREGVSFCRQFSKFVRAGFAMRRKTLSNNLVAAYSLERDSVVKSLEGLGLPPTIRGEALTPQQFWSLFTHLVGN